jgi:hypothetical protein
MGKEVSEIAEAHGFTFVCDKMSWGRRTICVKCAPQPRIHDMTYEFMVDLVDQLGIKVELWTSHLNRGVVEVTIKEWSVESS